MNKEEIWKDIPNYEGIYQASNLGRIKSLNRNVKHYTGVDRFIKERILKPSIDKSGYYLLVLCNNGNNKTCKIHQLIAITFLNHIPKGHVVVVNHKDFNKLNNNISNLELITQRENSNKKHVKSSSKYVGVSWSSNKNKWTANISVKDNEIHKKKFLGYYINEYDAHLAYEKALSELNKFKEILT